VKTQKIRQLLELIHHRQGVWHFVIRQVDGLLPDDFTHQKSFRLVRDLILRKERLPFRQILQNLLQQLLASIALQRRDRHQRRKRKLLRERVHQRQ
jgi:hypothetical protein